MEKEKYVDESWKETAEVQKEKLSSEPKVETQQPTQESNEASPAEPKDEKGPEKTQEPSEHEIAFVNYLSSLGFQAMVFLGEIPNPITNEPDKNLEQAKFLIDTIVMLQQKTKGNLSQQEESLINATAYELQLKYVAIKEKEQSEPKENS